MRGDQRPPPPLMSVYDGQRCIGHVVARGKAGFEAFDSDDRSLGIFASMKLAADTVSDEEAR